jgi:hypothetical protein
MCVPEIPVRSLVMDTDAHQPLKFVTQVLALLGQRQRDRLEESVAS